MKECQQKQIPSQVHLISGLERRLISKINQYLKKQLQNMLPFVRTSVNMKSHWQGLVNHSFLINLAKNGHSRILTSKLVSYNEKNHECGTVVILQVKHWPKWLALFCLLALVLFHLFILSYCKKCQTWFLSNCICANNDNNADNAIKRKA